MSERRYGLAVAGALAATVIVVGACGNSGPDPSYFAVRPVTRRAPPPCVAPALEEVLRPSGQVIACYELGPTGVDARDVRSATVTSSATQLSEVQFELTASGTKRWNALAQAVGAGGQVAIVVDGAISSAPKLTVTEFQGKGVVTGLDLSGAHRLAERLNRS